MTFSLPHLGHLIFALARSVMVSVASNSFSQLSHRNSYRGINSSSQLGSARRVYLRLRLLQPVRHPHLTVHRRRGGEVLARLLALARARAQLPEAEVAVGDERAHAARLGEGQRLMVVGLAALGIEPVGVGRDVTEQVERMGRAHELTQRGLKRAAAQALRVVETAKHQRGSPQPPIGRSEKADVSPRGLMLEKLLTFPQPAQALTRLAELRQNPSGGGDQSGKQEADVRRPEHRCRMLD